MKLLWLCVVAIIGACCCHGFSITPQRRTLSSSLLQVTVYYGDEWTHEDDNDDDEDATSSSSSSEGSIMIMESISQKYHATLARLACAFAPPGHALNNIQMASVANVGKDFVEISAILCEAMDCVNVAVPVPFLQTCSDLEESCVVDNLQQLDHLAVQKLQQQTLAGQQQHSEEEERDAHDLSIHQQLLNSGVVSFPPWWVVPTTDEMIDACDNVQALLNDAEFRNDLQILAQQQQLQLSGKVLQVAVVAAGPAGILLRAHLHEEDVVIDLPVPFSSQAAQSVDELEASVFGLVAATS